MQTVRFVDLSSRYRRVTSAYSSQYQRKSSRIDFRHISFSATHFELCDDQFVRYVLNDQKVRLNVIFDYNSMNTRRSRDGHAKIVQCKCLQKPAESLFYPRGRISTLKILTFLTSYNLFNSPLCARPLKKNSLLTFN